MRTDRVRLKTVDGTVEAKGWNDVEVDYEEDVLCSLYLGRTSCIVALKAVFGGGREQE